MKASLFKNESPFLYRILKISIVLLCLNALLVYCSPNLNELIRNGKIEEAKTKIRENEEWKRSNDCNSPLGLAAELGNSNLVRFLLENKADPNQREIGCPQKSILEIEGMYISKEEFFTATHTPISKSTDLEVAKILIEAGADVNLGGYRQNDPKGVGSAFYEPPLLQAVLNRKYDLAKFLIEKGAKTQMLNSITGENEFELWFSSVGIRNKTDRKFYEYLKTKGLKSLKAISNPLNPFQKTAVNLPKNDRNQNTSQERIYLHNPTGIEFKTTSNFLEQEEWVQTDLIYHSGEEKHFHSSEFTWKDTKRSVYEWILWKRILSKK